MCDFWLLHFAFTDVNLLIQISFVTEVVTTCCRNQLRLLVAICSEKVSQRSFGASCAMADSDWWRGADVHDAGQQQQQQWREADPGGSADDWWGTNHNQYQQQWQTSSWDSYPWSWNHSGWHHDQFRGDRWYQGTWHRNDAWSLWSWDRQNYDMNTADRELGSEAHADEVDGETQQRRQSKQTEATKASTSEDGGRLEDEEGSTVTDNKGIKTGKDYIPEFDGKTPMRDYERRVRLFEANTSIHPSYRAGKLIERLTDQAWRATEMLDIQTLKVSDGVDRLLRHLWGELEPLEFLRIFSTLNDFYKGFKRSTGQQFTEYDMEFRRQCQRLDEIDAGIHGVTRAYWFLEKAGLGPELRKQVVAAAGGCYDYPKLRAALVAIVPNVQKDEPKPGVHVRATSSQSHRPAQQYHAKKGASHNVHAVQEEHSQTAEDAEEEEPSEDEELDAEQLEEQAEVLMTQAARKRAANEKGRGFQKQETQAEREARVTEMKSRMACSACKANGFTRYGHWHNDRECPYYGQPKKSAKKKDKPEKDVFAVATEDLEESDDEFLIHLVQKENSVMASGIQKVRHGDLRGMALSDTCCSRSVSGEVWMQKHLKMLWEKGEDFYVLKERQIYRFGGGPRIASEYAALIPVNIPGSDRQAFLRVSVVKQSIPLLMSKSALQALGAVLDLPRGQVEFRALSTCTPLVTTPTGHVGFKIDAEPNSVNYAKVITFDDLCQHLHDDACEVVVAACIRTEGQRHEHDSPQTCYQEPRKLGKGVGKRDNVHVDTIHQCSSARSESGTSCTTNVRRVIPPDQDDHHGGDDSSEAKTRVRGQHCCADEGLSRELEQARLGSVEGHLDDHQAEQTHPGVSTGMEEVQSVHPSADVLPTLCRGARSPQRRPLGKVEEERLDHGARVLRGPEDGRAGDGTEAVGQPHMPRVRHSYDVEDKSDEQRGLLGMHEIPVLQVHSTLVPSSCYNWLQL